MPSLRKSQLPFRLPWVSVPIQLLDTDVPVDYCFPPDAQMIDADIGKTGERFVAELCESAAFADYVFANPKYLRGSLEKELCDVLVLFENTVFLIQIKTASRSAHYQFHPEKRQKWKKKKIAAATKQLEGAHRAMLNKRITTVSNERRGRVTLPDPAELRFFGLVVVDYLKEEPLHPGVLPLPHVDGMKTLLFNFGDLVVLTHELSTIGDLHDYINIRAELQSVIFEDSDELDLLAFFKTHRDVFDLRDADTSLPDFLLLQEGIWNEYSSLEARSARDEADRPSRMFDAIVDMLYDGRLVPDAFTAKEPSEPTEDSPHDERYIEILNELNRYRRVERRVIGEKLIEKMKVCSAQRPDRYFLGIYPDRCPVLFLISRSPRSKRMKQLQYLTLAAKLYQSLPKIIGIATEPLQFRGRSVDSLCLESDPAVDRRDWTPEMIDQLQDVFSEPRSISVDEYPK